MPRAIGDDELAVPGSEEAIGDIDGDALFTLGGKAVDQQRKIGLFALCAHAATIGIERLELVGVQRLAVVEQAPDQRRFAIVDAAAGDETQEGTLDGHQK